MPMKPFKDSLLVISILFLLLFVSGTWALMKANETPATPLIGGRLHDDYRQESLEGVSNKNIYAENYGTAPLIVRVKLVEYLENNNTPILPRTDKQNSETWIPYGLPQSSESQNYRKYVTWSLGGDKNFLPTFNRNPENLESDASGDAVDMTTKTQTALGDGSIDYFNSDQLIPHPDDSSITQRVKATLTQCHPPISMEEWSTLPFNKQEGEYWVIDQDGWAYWSKLLPPTEATSLLINSLIWQVSGIGNLESWHYDIQASGEFSTPNNRFDFNQSSNGAPSQEGWRLLNRISPTTSLTIGDTFDFYGEEYIYLKDLGQGNKLVLRKYLLEEDTYTTTNYLGSPLENVLQNYYDNLSAEAKAAVQPIKTTFPLELINKEAAGLDTSGFLAPLAQKDLTIVSEKGESTAFALSLADLTSVSGPNLAFPTIESRQGVKQSSPTITRHWWLRTPYDVTYKGMQKNLFSEGQLTSFSDEQLNSVRPALVIRY